MIINMYDFISQIWSACTIADHPVNAQYVEPPFSCQKEEDPIIDFNWAARHVRHGQYCLMISKWVELSMY